MARARNTDPTTSHEAAASVSLTNTEIIRQVILDMLAVQPATDCFIQDSYRKLREGYGWPRVGESTIRTRRAELVDAGLVEESGEYERLETGRRAIVWRLADHG